MTDQKTEYQQLKQPYEKPRLNSFGLVRELTQAGSVANQEQAAQCNPNANSFGTLC
jgi:hypothetical protein